MEVKDPLFLLTATMRCGGKVGDRKLNVNIKLIWFSEWLGKGGHISLSGQPVSRLQENRLQENSTSVSEVLKHSLAFRRSARSFE